jgi:predicted nucleotidyltransferase component of viral defense system
MLRTETVAPHLLELLKDLMQKEYLRKFVLVGGTALSLQIGHRKSEDLDMFSPEPFETAELKSHLEDNFSSFNIDLERTNSLITTINTIKVDFIRFKYGFDYPFIKHNKIRLANIKDIAPMKLDAISGRGKKKDFFDLYFLLKQFSLTELLSLYQAKYKHTSIFHVIKSINYFEEAENESDPTVFDKTVTWKKVKTTIAGEIKKL